VTLKGKNKEADIKALVDSGASTLFLNKKFVDRNNVDTKRLKRALPVRNIDGTSNSQGPITDYAELGLKIGDHYEQQAAFMITDLGEDDCIIGIDWLRYHNPDIDWNAGKFKLTRCPVACTKVKRKKTKKRVEDLPDLLPTEDDDLDMIDPDNAPVEDSKPSSINKAKIVEEIEDQDSPRNIWIRKQASVASELAQKEYQEKNMDKKSFKDLVHQENVILLFLVLFTNSATMYTIWI